MAQYYRKKGGTHALWPHDGMALPPSYEVVEIADEAIKPVVEPKFKIGDVLRGLAPVYADLTCMIERYVPQRDEYTIRYVEKSAHGYARQAFEETYG